ncbi:MAG: Gfo/Idh/MocA family protein [Anaerolineae bacterium]
MSAPFRLAIVGGGWRAAFYLRIARALPERFDLQGLVIRDPGKGLKLEQEWGVATFRSVTDLLASSSPEFVVTCVAWEPNAALVEQLAALGLPVLSETPPAPDLARLHKLAQLVQRGAKIQVAEQYIYQPHHAARLAIAKSGLLGTVTEAQVSVCHGYHGLSLMRHFLNIGYENVRITARSFSAPLVGGPGRDGPPAQESIANSNQVLSWFDFGDRLGVYDFTGDQYFSWVRGQRLLLRGERGELSDMQASYLIDYATPMQMTLQRQTAGADGNLEGLYLKGYTGNSKWWYRNPFIPAALSDEEIAIASVLERMGTHSRDEGAGPYPLAEACQDRYLDILLEQAVKSGAPVTSETQPWAE